MARFNDTKQRSLDKNFSCDHDQQLSMHSSTANNDKAKQSSYKTTKYPNIAISSDYDIDTVNPLKHCSEGIHAAASETIPDKQKTPKHQSKLSLKRSFFKTISSSFSSFSSSADSSTSHNHHSHNKHSSQMHETTPQQSDPKNAKPPKFTKKTESLQQHHHHHHHHLHAPKSNFNQSLLSINWSNLDYDKEDFAEAFSIFDKDGDGRITASELKKVLSELGIKLSKDDIKNMIQELDKDGNGTIEYSEFVQMMTQPASRDADDFELREAFKCIDLDGNGYISRDELRDAVKKIMSTDKKLSVDDVEEMMTEADEDGNGLIDYDEFVRILVEKRN